MMKCRLVLLCRWWRFFDGCWSGIALLVLLTSGLLIGCAAEATLAPAPKPPAASEAKPVGPQSFPAARALPVVNTYHGVEITDPYQWLERGDAPAVRRWVAKQNQLSRRVLAGLPGRDRIVESIRGVYEHQAPSYYPIVFRSGLYFSTKRQPPKQQPFLVVFDDPNRPTDERVIVDPGVLDPSGGTHIDWFEPSPDGRLVAVSMSVGGTEAGDVHLFETATGRATGEVVPRVQGGTAGGDLEWTRDGQGFFYTRYPAPGERAPEDESYYQQLYYHQLGSPATKDRYELGSDFPKIAEIRLSRAPDSEELLATVQKGDGGEFRLYLRDASGRWRQLSEFGDQILQATFGYGGDLYLLSRKQAPLGKILRLRLPDLDVAKGVVVVPPSDASIITDFWEQESILATRSRLYVKVQTGGPSELRVFTLNGERVSGPKQQPVSSMGAVVPLRGDDLLFSTGSFARPWSWQYSDAEADSTTVTPLSNRERIDLSSVEVVREFAVSKDGTKVPLNILLPPGVPRDGSAPCVITGYGGYGVSLSPRYSRFASILLSQGIIYAVANLRGGGEYGEAWHRQGNLTKKQNVFDDFAASIKTLVERRYTNSERLVAMGRSNGGLLMGATLTQHPELVRAVVSSVGIYDMLRVELSPNGAFNITEFGTVTDRAQFDALRAYSPYHHVTAGTAYPATLMLTGANDPRVDPMHSRKMVARLQAATTGDTVLLRQHDSSGHGGSKKLSDTVEEAADIAAFILDQLAVEFRQP